MTSKAQLLFIVGLGVFLRASLRFSSYYGEIARRVEVSSPVSAWIRVVEGVTLRQNSISPYSGHTFHESPIFLQLYRVMIETLCECQIGIVFIVIDIVTAFILARVCIDQLSINQRVEERRLELAAKKDHDDKKIFQSLLVPSDSIANSAFWVTSIYILSPYSILSCVGQSTSVLANFQIALILLTATHGFRVMALALLALLSLNTFYSVILLIPCLLMIEQRLRLTAASSAKQDLTINFALFSTRNSLLISAALFALFITSFFYISLWLENWSYEFVHSTYIYMWTVSDLTPNIGMLWYFFTEMFDHFQTFFLWVFQINYFIYIIPLTLKTWRNPYLLAMLALINHAIFKPYPTVADFTLYLSLLPQWSHLFENMKSILVVSCTIVCTSVLAPILWYLWIILVTANSNFYFGITMAFNVAQILILTDLTFSYIRREFYLSNLDLFKLCKQAGKSLRIELSYKANNN